MIYRFILKGFHAKLERNLGKSDDQFVIMQQSNYFLKVAYIYHPSDLLFFVLHVLNQRERYWVKSVRIRSYSEPYFPAFGLNTERYSVFSPNAEKCGPE